MLSNVDYKRWRFEINMQDIRDNPDRANFVLYNLRGNRIEFDSFRLRLASNSEWPYQLILDNKATLSMSAKEITQFLSEYVEMIKTYHKEANES